MVVVVGGVIYVQSPSVGLTGAGFWVMGGVVMLVSEGIVVQWFV